MTITFVVIKHTVGLRVTEEEEITGLDKLEHGLESAYAGFFRNKTYTGATAVTVSAPELSVTEAVPTVAVNGEGKINKIVIIAKAEKMDALKVAMNDIGVTGMTVTRVSGCGVQKGQTAYYRGAKVDIQLLPKVKAEIVVSSIPVQTVVDAAKVFYTLVIWVMVRSLSIM